MLGRGKIKPMTDDELKGLFDALREENAGAHAETRQRFDTAVETMRRHFDVTFEGLRYELRLIAKSVSEVKENLATLGKKIERTAAETQATLLRAE